ncbi:MAG: DUF4384 domain-containing protein [Acidobacteriia bacterium]|nr:DUF4384 domain-containing protein [Terriglobia bacterium]
MRKTVLCGIALFVIAAIAQVETMSGLRRQPRNVSYGVLLIRNGQRMIVPNSYRFETGDRFALRVRVASDSFVYLLNRTFSGQPDVLRSNHRIRLMPPPNASPQQSLPDDARSTAYTLVYPPSGHRLLRAGEIQAVPDANMAMEMDEHPGMEQLLLVVSPTRLIFPELPDTSNLFEQRLRQMANNTDAVEASANTPPLVLQPSVGDFPAAPRSAVVNKRSPRPPATAGSLSPEGISAPKNPREPFLVEVVLAHYNGKN